MQSISRGEMPLVKRRRVVHVVRSVAVALVVIGGLIGLARHSDASSSGTVGTATLVDPSDGITPVVAGGSATQFTLKLSLSPGKPIAACSADSANGSTFEMSYLVHEGVRPSTLTFPGNQPSQGLFLYDQAAASPFEAVNTAPSTGQVNVSTFSFGHPFTASQVLYNSGGASVWETGIACDKTSVTPDVVTDYWSVQITFLPSTTDPNGYTFTVALSPPPTTTTTTGSTTTTTSGSTTTTTASNGNLGAGLGGSAGGSASGSDPFGTSSSGGAAPVDMTTTAGSGAGLAVTGTSVRQELNVGLGALWVGVALMLLTLILPRTSRGEGRRRK